MEPAVFVPAPRRRKELGSRRSIVKLWIHGRVGLLDVSSGLVGVVGFHQAFSVVKVLVP